MPETHLSEHKNVSGHVDNCIPGPEELATGAGEIAPVDGPADLDLVVLISLFRSDVICVRLVILQLAKRRGWRVHGAGESRGSSWVEGRRVVDLLNGAAREIHYEIAVRKLTGAKLDEVGHEDDRAPLKKVPV